MSGAGDVNHDGYADVIIGAYTASPNGRLQAGVSYILFGKATGFGTIDLASFTSGPNGFIVQGATSGSYTGFSVSGAGDVNGDGCDDILIAGYTASPHGRSQAGISYILFGKAGGFSTIDLASFTSGANGFIVQGAASWSYTGFSVSGAGDVNDDGYADVIIGAYNATQYGNQGAGTSYVILGKKEGFATIDLARISDANGFIVQGAPKAAGMLVIAGAAIGDASGYAVSSAGDVNNDGYKDMIVGAYYASSSSNLNGGATYVIYGGPYIAPTTTMATTTLSTTTTVAIPEESGYSVSFLTVGVPILSALAAIASIAYTLTRCHKDKVWCFREKTETNPELAGTARSSAEGVKHLVDFVSQDFVQRVSAVSTGIFQTNPLYDDYPPAEFPTAHMMEEQQQV